MTRLTAALLAVILLLPQSALAGGFLDSLTQYKKGNIKFGKMKVAPYAELTQKYDSNIYAVPKDKPDGTSVGGGVLGSWISEAVAGLKFDLPLTGMHKFKGDVEGKGYRYETQPAANNGEDFAASLTYNYKGPMGFSAEFSDSFLNTEDPAFSASAARERRWENTAEGLIEYAPEGGRLYAALEGQHVAHKYCHSVSLAASLNRYEQLFGGRIGMRVQPKTKVFLGARRQLIVYTVRPNVRHSQGWLLDAGIEGKILPKLTGELRTGVQLRRINEDLSTDNTNYTRNWRIKTDLTYKPLKRTKVMLNAGRSLEESTFGSNRFYISNTVGVDVEHKLPRKLTAKMGISATIDKYPEATTTGGHTANRRDDLYVQSVGLDYDIQEWLQVGAAYDHTEKFSIFSGQFNYERHLTSMFLKLMF